MGHCTEDLNHYSGTPSPGLGIGNEVIFRRAGQYFRRSNAPKIHYGDPYGLYPYL